jgi:hypothetical protein
MEKRAGIVQHVLLLPCLVIDAFPPPFYPVVQITTKPSCASAMLKIKRTLHGSLHGVPVMRRALILFGIPPAPSTGPAAPPCLRPLGRSDSADFLWVLSVTGVETYATTVRAQTSRIRLRRRAMETMESLWSKQRSLELRNRTVLTDIFWFSSTAHKGERKESKAHTTWLRTEFILHRRRRALLSWSTTLDATTSFMDRLVLFVFLISFVFFARPIPTRVERQLLFVGGGRRAY